MEPTFQVCEKCGLHGHVIYSDREFSSEVDSKLYALKVIQNDVDWGYTDPRYHIQLIKVVKESSLPETDNEVDLLIMSAVISWNSVISLDPDDPLHNNIGCIVELFNEQIKEIRAISESVAKSRHAQYN